MLSLRFFLVAILFVSLVKSEALIGAMTVSETYQAFSRTSFQKEVGFLFDCYASDIMIYGVFPVTTGTIVDFQILNPSEKELYSPNGEPSELTALSGNKKMATFHWWYDQDSAILDDFPYEILDFELYEFTK